MTIETKSRPRLSGWVRLWMVFAALSWITGAADFALSGEPFRLPLSLSDATPRSVRLLLWLSAPLIIAAVSIVTRWIWRDFRPPSEEAAAPHMTTMEIVRRGFRLLAKAGVVLFLLALAAGVVWATIIMISWDEAHSIWMHLLVLNHTLFVGLILHGLWQVITEPFD